MLGWLVTPTPIPLYDGVGTPDEAYRYVVPPADYRSTPPASEARSTIGVDAGRSCCELEARSAEQGPQVSVYVPRGGLAVTGAQPLTLRAVPVAPPPGPAPGEKTRYEGNVYEVTAATPAGPARLTPEAARATIQLRALNGNDPQPQVWYRDGPSSAWRSLPTSKAGFDIYEAQFVGTGQYVLVRGKGGAGGTVTLLLGILAIPAILVVALIVLRLRSGPPADDDEDALADEDGEADDGNGDPGAAGGAGTGSERRVTGDGGP